MFSKFPSYFATSSVCDFLIIDIVRIPTVAHVCFRSTGGRQSCGTVPHRCTRAMSRHGHGGRGEGEATPQTVTEPSRRQPEHEQVQPYVRHGQCLVGGAHPFRFVVLTRKITNYVIHLQDSKLIKN